MEDAQVSCAHQVLHFMQCLCLWPPLACAVQWFMPHAPLPSWLWWYNPPPPGVGLKKVPFGGFLTIMSETKYINCTCFDPFDILYC